MTAKRRKLTIPPQRKRQFDMIAAASSATLKWAQEQGVPLERIEPVVPFVRTDFSLHAWLFLDTENRIQQYRSDGTEERLALRFRADLTNSGYPAEWSALVTCHFASKEVVDRDYEGNYFYFLH